MSVARVIAVSNMAQVWYIISSWENFLYVDLGATLTACGSAVAAYSFFVL